MTLPKLPAQSTKRAVDTVAFLGLNRMENTTDGEIRDAQNLSVSEYPCLTQRGKRLPVSGYSAPTDIFAWDGHLVVVDGGKLYLDGVEKASVTSGRKQFAVVNTKLCVWPDKFYIDLTNSTSGMLGASLETSGRTGSVEITHNSFTAALRRVAEQEGYADLEDVVVYVYGKDIAAVEACCQPDEEHPGEYKWVFPEGLEVKKGGSQLELGDIFIPRIYEDEFLPVTAYIGNPDKTLYNKAGYYSVVTSVPITITYTTYQTALENPKLSDTFRVGDGVRISGTLDGKCNVKAAIIRAIDDSTNTLTFDDNTFTVPEGYDTSAVHVTISKEIPDLDFICEKDNRLWGVSNSTQNEAWNPDTKKTEVFTSRVIYASALGDPTNWWVFDGVDTDSYQVAVGSEGDFTAICAFSDAVCCWKEHRVYKILGNYPSEYYMSDSSIEGVAAGCFRSLTVVNETLYYVGATGIYAYSGSVPVLIGYPLDVTLSSAAGGSDGKRWYLSGTRPDAATELLTYDFTHRLWMREDSTGADGFTVMGGTLYVLAGGGIFKTEQGVDDDLEWYAEFCPFYEAGQGRRYANTSLIRRYYLRILLRLEMAAGSSVTVQVKEDGDDWKTLLNEDAQIAAVKSVAFQPKRCDKLTIRISGTGHVLLRHMGREYIQGSERP